MSLLKSYEIASVTENRIGLKRLFPIIEHYFSHITDTLHCFTDGAAARL